MPEYGDTFKVVKVQFGKGLDRYTYITDPTAKVGDKLNLPSHKDVVIREVGPSWGTPQRFDYRGEVKYAPVLKAKYCECCGQELQKKNKDGYPVYPPYSKKCC